MEMRLSDKRISNKWLLPFVHFWLTFFYEWTILELHPSENVVMAVAKSTRYSDTFERIMAYLISKLLAAVLIFFVWKLIFYVIHAWREDRALRRFCILFFVGVVVLFLLWPGTFYRSVDNYITYSYATALYPEYWHNAYSGFVYAACLMTIPHPFSICLFQWLLFVFNLGYFYHRLSRSKVCNRKSGFLIFLLILLPETYVLISDAYRTEQYALVCMTFVFTVLLDLVERKEYCTKKLVGMAFLSAFLAVWRTEGIILGTLFFVAVLLFDPKRNLKRFLCFFAVFCACFLAVSFPQKVGNEKYYGSDYSIINSFCVLTNVFNMADSNLEYDGVEEDLAAIEAVVPIEQIRVLGMEGYRRYNYYNGHADINQSLTDMETGKRYIKAFYNICLHNPKIYLRTQFGMLKAVLKFPKTGYVQYARIELSQNYPNYQFIGWTNGKKTLMEYPLVSAWDSIAWRKNLTKNTLKGLKTFENFLSKICLYPVLLISIAIFAVVIFLVDGFGWIGRIKKGEKTMPPIFAFAAMALLGQCAAIAAVMPVGVFVYFHASYYSLVILEIIFVGYRWKKR